MNGDSRDTDPSEGQAKGQDPGIAARKAFIDEHGMDSVEEAAQADQGAGSEDRVSGPERAREPAAGQRDRTADEREEQGLPSDKKTGETE